MYRLLLIVAGALLGAGSVPAHSASSAAPARVSGTVRSLAGQVLTVSSTKGAQRVPLAPQYQVILVIPSDWAHITPGSFVGVASVRQRDGSQKAREIHIYPESMRGDNEGRQELAPSDGRGGDSQMIFGTVSRSSMTTGTVSGSRSNNSTPRLRSRGTAMTLQYKSGGKSGFQTLMVMPSAPIVTYQTGQPSDIKAGAHVTVDMERQPDGTLAGRRVLVGTGGRIPPM